MEVINVSEEALLSVVESDNPEVSFNGTKVTVSITQPLTDSEGVYLGEARVTVIGRRVFGKRVHFALPLEVGMVNVPKGEEAYFSDMARFTIEEVCKLETVR